MPLQDRFFFRFGFILTFIVSLVLVNPCQSFAGDAPDGWKFIVPEDVNIPAEKGDACSQFIFGHLYFRGQGVPQDYKKAIKWYHKAAEQGLAIAQFNLARMYENGYGVPQDYEEAVKWYQKSAEQGFAGAQCNLGLMYYNGYGVSQDYKEAIKWYRKAAEQGQAYAQFNLGFMYWAITRDYIKAYAWFNLAALQGDATAQDARDKLASTSMTPQQIASAQELCAELRAVK